MLIRIAITQDWVAPHTLEWTDRAWQGVISQNKIRAMATRMAAINQLILSIKRQ